MAGGRVQQEAARAAVSRLDSWTGHTMLQLARTSTTLFSLVHVFVYSPKLFPRKRTDSYPYLSTSKCTYALLEALNGMAY